MAENEPFLQAKVAPNREEKIFQTQGDLVKYGRDLIARWDWLSSIGPDGSIALWNQFKGGITSLSAGLGDHQAWQFSNGRANILSVFSQWSSGNASTMGPEDPRMQLPLKLFEENGPAAANGALIFLAKGRFNFSNHVDADYIFGMFRALLFVQGLENPTPYDERLLNDFFAKQEERFSALGKTFKEKIAEATEATEQSRGAIQVSKTEADNQRNEFTHLVMTSSNEMTTMRRTLAEELKLDSAVKYWSAQAVKHDNLSKAASGTVRWHVAGIVFFISAYIIGFTWLSEGKHPELWQLGGGALITGILLYLLRIAVRIQLSHLHLSTDAEQRALMAQTYRALEHDKQAVGKEDRHLVLEALFRPVGAGLVKDDQSSLSIVEYLMNRKTGG